MRDPRGHYCPECNTWRDCPAEPCLLPLIDPCAALDCDGDWRLALDENHQPFPEWYAMARNIFPWRQYLHPEQYNMVNVDEFFAWQVYEAFHVHLARRR